MSICNNPLFSLLEERSSRHRGSGEPKFNPLKGERSGRVSSPFVAKTAANRFVSRWLSVGRAPLFIRVAFSSQIDRTSEKLAEVPPTIDDDRGKRSRQRPERFGAVLGSQSLSEAESWAQSGPEVAWNFFFSEATNHPAPLGAPFVDHQHHTRAEGLKARSQWFLHETAPKLVDLASRDYSQPIQTVASRLGAKN